MLSQAPIAPSPSPSINLLCIYSSFSICFLEDLNQHKHPLSAWCHLGCPKSFQREDTTAWEQISFSFSFSCLKWQLSPQASRDHGTRNEHGSTTRGSSRVVCDSFAHPGCGRRGTPLSTETSLPPELDLVCFKNRKMVTHYLYSQVAQRGRFRTTSPCLIEQTRLCGSQLTQV